VLGLTDLTVKFDCLAGRHTIGLAVSGGPDSLALLRLAVDWQRRQPAPPRLIVYSVDHALRSEAADEVRFVLATAARLGLEARALCWDGPKPATGRQAAARVARYRLIGAAMAADGADLLLTAHHQDDQAETVLMRLAHGSGLAGLRGMESHATVEGVPVFRPFLDVPRAVLAAVVARAGLTPVSDPSNADPHYERARWRAGLPGLAALGLDSPALAAFARRAGEADAALGQWAESVLRAQLQIDSFGVATLPLATLAALPPAIQTRLLARLVALAGGNRAPRQLGAVERLRDRLVGEPAFAGATIAGVALSRRGEAIAFAREPGRQAGLDVTIPEGGQVVWDGRFRIANGSGAPVRIRPAGDLTRRQAEALLGRPVASPARAIRAAPLVLDGAGRVLALGRISLDGRILIGFSAFPCDRNAT
jgi:tRNA(Ile)-lysidine synthase